MRLMTSSAETGFDTGFGLSKDSVIITEKALQLEYPAKSGSCRYSYRPGFPTLQLNPSLVCMLVFVYLELLNGVFGK
jgi:hypothetical protein